MAYRGDPLAGLGVHVCAQEVALRAQVPHSLHRGLGNDLCRGGERSQQLRRTTSGAREARTMYVGSSVSSESTPNSSSSVPAHATVVTVVSPRGTPLRKLTCGRSPN